MSDKETYQYQDDDAVKSTSYEDYIDENQEASGPQSLINNPKFIGFASLVVGIYLVGYVISMFTESTPQSKPVVQQAAPAPKNDQLDQLAAALNKQQVMMQQISSSNQQLNVAVNDLKKEVTTLKSSEQLPSNNNSVGKSDIDRISNQLADLRDRVILTEQTLKSMQPKPAKKPLLDLYLRGIIEGRAWITNDKGRNVTIRVGDSLPDYGRVTGIFPEAGYVTTESKRKITFSKGDS